MSVSLQFALNIEDDWPPVGSESLPFEKTPLGYRCLSVPMFVTDLSVDDVIDIEQDTDGLVQLWRHLRKSKHSTIWLLRLNDDPPIQDSLHLLHLLQCNTAGLDDLGCYAIDVPPSVPLTEIDNVLEKLDPNLVAKAFPSMRHAE